jgi:type IX secretion system PorP/SprF family membrane protein
LSTLMLDLDLAGHVRVGEHQIVSAGLQGGFGQQSVQTSNLTWDNQFNGFNYVPGSSSGEHFANSAFTYPDIGAGVLYQYNKGEAYISGNNNLHAEAGFSLSHINQPLLTFYESNQSTNYLYMKYTVHGNMTFGLKNTPISLMPGFVFYRQGPNQELMVGSLVKYTLKEDSKYTGYVRGASIALGAYYRWDDAVIITSLFELANYAIGFSYDVNVSDLRAASNGFGGFEIALRYVNPSNFLYQNRARF